MGKIATHKQWNATTKQRLEAVAEEALLILIGQHEDFMDQRDTSSAGARRLHVVVTADRLKAVLEFISAPSKAENLENRLAILREPAIDISDISTEPDIALRLLRHYSKSVTHRQYIEAEIITAIVEVATAD